MVAFDREEEAKVRLESSVGGLIARILLRDDEAMGEAVLRLAVRAMRPNEDVRALKDILL